MMLTNDSITFQTASEWDETLWQKAEPVYRQGFPEHGRKSLPIIRRMFHRRMCRLYTMTEGTEVTGMALTGYDHIDRVLIIDYLAIRTELRHGGRGRRLMEEIEWEARQTAGCRGIVVEVESGQTEENARRIRFWEGCGFQLTEYVHSYIWVPEPYRAMYKSFDPQDPLPNDGEKLFRSITRFHQRAYSK